MDIVMNAVTHNMKVIPEVFEAPQYQKTAARRLQESQLHIPTCSFQEIRHSNCKYVESISKTG